MSLCLEGITTTIDLHKKILNHKKFINSDFDTNWIGKEKNSIKHYILLSCIS